VSRWYLAPVATIYGGAVATKNLAYENRWLKAKLRWPVVSIGNLSVGGSGKTPLTVRLAELLAADGVAVDVLSRGYGRTSRTTERVDPAGDAECFGDEPLLIARRTGLPVFVGASRYQAGLMAEEGIGQNPTAHLPAVHLLDDGFQHRQLARDVDIVVVHRTDFGERLLPAGRLREPLSAMRRADFLALREEDADLEPRLYRLRVTAPVLWMRRSLTTPNQLVGTTAKVIAFCGIARPDEFFSALIAKDINVELAVTFADHHRYLRDDANRLATAATEAHADAFVTTEKDAVRLDPSLLQVLESAAPVRVARLEVSLRDETSVLSQLRAKLPPSSAPAAG
jgi:tetraacyldisaccharide 4'-kinase